MSNYMEFLVMDLFLLMMAHSDIQKKKYSSNLLLLLKELSVRSQISFLCLFKWNWKARVFQIQDDSEDKQQFIRLK